MYSWLHNLNTYYLNLILISFLLNATQNAIYTDTHSIDWRIAISACIMRNVCAPNNFDMHLEN